MYPLCVQTAAPLQRIPGKFKGRLPLLLASEGDGSQEPTSQHDEKQQKGPNNPLKSRIRQMVCAGRIPNLVGGLGWVKVYPAAAVDDHGSLEDGGAYPLGLVGRRGLIHQRGASL
ncbi:unnamed protein product [Boreogadus saida]